MDLPGGDALARAWRELRLKSALSRIEEVLGEVARREGGATVRDAYTDDFPRVRLPGDDTTGMISIVREGQSDLRVGVVCRSLLAEDEQFDFPGIEMHPSWQSRDCPVPWMRPVGIGDSVLDARFAVYSHDGRTVSHLFTPGVRQALLGLHYFLDVPGVRFTLGERLLAVRKPAPCHSLSASTLQELLRRVRVLFDRLREQFVIATDAVIEFIEDGRVTIETRCRVCGERLDEKPVLCAACETPHHSDCWQYLGRCAIFACGNRTFILAPSVPRPATRGRRGRYSG